MEACLVSAERARRLAVDGAIEAVLQARFEMGCGQENRLQVAQVQALVYLALGINEYWRAKVAINRVLTRGGCRRVICRGRQWYRGIRVRDD
jgi:hypothetical protein